MCGLQSPPERGIRTQTPPFPCVLAPCSSHPHILYILWPFSFYDLIVTLFGNAISFVHCLGPVRPTPTITHTSSARPSHWSTELHKRGGGKMVYSSHNYKDAKSIKFGEPLVGSRKWVCLGVLHWIYSIDGSVSPPSNICCYGDYYGEKDLLKLSHSLM